MILPETAPADILARTLYGEARGEPELGRIAVGYVVLNRAARPGWWGHDVASVCLCPRQFSCWNLGDPNRAPMEAVTPADPAFAQCLALAGALLSGTDADPPLADPTLRATYYHELDCHPVWASALIRTVEIGRHVFYREKETFE